MCGISGFWYFSEKKPNFEHLLSSMASSMAHRGPDGEGKWFDPEIGIGFSHRRLNVVDLSNFGHQPMVSRNKRWVISYNGEIYNAPELHSELKNKGISLKGHSDTEAVLEYISLFGLDFTLSKLVGMFAFSLWDSKSQTLHLARDRIGIKPLYWTHQKMGVWFSSELKTMVKDSTVVREINPEAIDKLIHYGYIPAPSTIYTNIFKLLPGHTISFKKYSDPVLQSYWSLEETIEKNYRSSYSPTEKDLYALLKNVVEQHSYGDVNLGAFLSGGIDSTLIVALMKEFSSNPIKTYCIGFDEESYNEAPYAKEIARFLGTDHTEHYITTQEIMEIIPKLPIMYDEPLGDSSQIPTYLVSCLARQEVKVILSGDGGDELFGGYKRYLQGNMLAYWRNHIYNPSSLNKGLSLIPENLKKILHFFLPHIFRKWGYPESFIRVSKLLSSKNHLELYDILIDLCPNTILVNNKNAYQSFLPVHLLSLYPIEYFLYFDQKFYLPDDILAKVDRASMATGLEVRVPFLDHRVVSMAWKLPLNAKIQKNVRKKILRSILSKHLPKKLYERPKMGFRFPIDDWLRGPLKVWAGDLLHGGKLSCYFNKDGVENAWNQHLNNQKNNGNLLWSILMFQAWQEKY